MEPMDELARSLNHNHQFTLGLVKGLTREQLAWRPSPVANPAGFILWHLARNEDLWMHRLPPRRTQVYEAAGFDRRFGLTIPEGNSIWITVGTGWTAEHVAAFPACEPALLLEYLEAVRADTLSYLSRLMPADPDAQPWPGRSPNTLGWVLRQMANHEANHAGQIDYLHGLHENRVL
ncbi:MAG: DinB family protein [Dehalococcoidia bacterium]|nr:DinB family protein [Dehalococcoidia bacterium]